MINEDRCLLIRDRKTGAWYCALANFIDISHCVLSHDIADAHPIGLGEYKLAFNICEAMRDCGYDPQTMFYPYPITGEVNND